MQHLLFHTFIAKKKVITRKTTNGTLKQAVLVLR